MTTRDEVTGMAIALGILKEQSDNFRFDPAYRILKRRTLAMYRALIRSGRPVD